MSEIPKNECRGCADRDRIIEKLANRIDALTASDLSREPIELEIPTIEGMSGLIDFGGRAGF